MEAKVGYTDADVESGWWAAVKMSTTVVLKRSQTIKIEIYCHIGITTQRPIKYHRMKRGRDIDTFPFSSIGNH